MKKTLSFVLVAAMLLCMIPAFGIFADEAERTIGTPDELIAFVNEANEAGKGFLAGKTVKVTADLDMAGKTYTPIKDGVFVLDFDGHTVSNLNVTVENSGDAGLIANKMSNGGGNGGIVNVTLKNCTLTVKNAGSTNVGGAIGYADRAYADGINMENVTINSEASGAVGAVIGNRSWGYDNHTNMSGTIKGVTINAPKATVGIIVGSIGGDAKIAFTNIDASVTVNSSTNALGNDTYVGSGANADNVTIGDNVKATADVSKNDAVTLQTIDTPEELVKFMAKANEIGDSYRKKETIKVTADLDMSGYTVTPIKKAIFLLDFQGHTVSNLTVTVDNAEGEIGMIANRLANDSFNGGVANLKLKNCMLTVNVAAEKTVTVGGVVGMADRAYATPITMENVTIKVNGAGVVGGVIGQRDWGSNAGNDMTVTMKDVVIDAPEATVGIVVGKTTNDVKTNIAAVDATLTVKSKNEVTATTYVGEIGVAENVTVAETGVKAELVDNAAGYVPPKAPEQKPEDKPEDKPEKPAPTGDAMVVLAVLAVVSLAGVAVVSKKRSVC